MKAPLLFAALAAMCLAAPAPSAAEPQDIATLQQQFRQLPNEARRLTGPLFWLHGDESQERLETYIAKIAEGGNGSFTAESRPHNDWLGEGWYRDLGICLNAAKKHNLQMWIFDEKWWPSQGIGGKVPARYSAKRLSAAAEDVEGPKDFAADGYGGDRYVAALAGRLNDKGEIEGDSLVDLAANISGGKLSWQVPAGKWKIIKFTHVQGPSLGQGGQLSVDGASKDCVDWYIQTVYQPHYDHFKADFGKTIPGFFYDEPETRGDWGTELSAVLAARKVDWKKAYAAYKFTLAGEEQTAARFQYLDAFAETWGRTMYGGITQWCHEHGVKSMGHFMEHKYLYVNPEFCAGDMMRLQRYSDMGAIDLVCRQMLPGSRPHDIYQTPKLASSISHVFGKENHVTMCEMFGGYEQKLTYSQMKWLTDQMQVRGVNFMIPHSFNPRAPYDNDYPPYFYNSGLEPRWPLYRVYADYTSRLSLMLTGGRHVCPVAVLFSGNTRQVGYALTPEDMTTALQDALFDCDWLPVDVFESDAEIEHGEIALNDERYRVLVVPAAEAISYRTLAKVKRFFDKGGVVVGYGMLPSKSTTLGKSSAEIAALVGEIWGDKPEPGTTAGKTNAAGGRAYLLAEKPTRDEITAALAVDAKLPPRLNVIDGETDGWVHVLHRVKAGRDLFFVCNQNLQGGLRPLRCRVLAEGEPEKWDAMRGEFTAAAYQRVGKGEIELTLLLNPSESVLLVFQSKNSARPAQIPPGAKVLSEAITLVREPNPPVEETKPEPMKAGKKIVLSPVAAADPFRGRATIPADVDLARCHVYLQMDNLPDDSAAVTVNGIRIGGVIGRPGFLEITRSLKPGENTIIIEPLAPSAARLVFFLRD